MVKRSRAVKLLKDHLEAKGMTKSAAARELGVSAPTMQDWLDATKRPRPSLRLAIARWTDGAVPASAWVTAAELREAEAIVAAAKGAP